MRLPPDPSHSQLRLSLDPCSLQRRERINSLAAVLGKSTTLKESFPLHMLLLKFFTFKVLISFTSNWPPGFSYF